MEPSCLDGGPWVTTLPLGSGGGGGDIRETCEQACLHSQMHVQACCWMCVCAHASH